MVDLDTGRSSSFDPSAVCFWTSCWLESESVQSSWPTFSSRPDSDIGWTWNWSWVCVSTSLWSSRLSPHHPRSSLVKGTSFWGGTYRLLRAAGPGRVVPPRSEPGTRVAAADRGWNDGTIDWWEFRTTVDILQSGRPSWRAPSVVPRCRDSVLPPSTSSRIVPVGRNPCLAGEPHTDSRSVPG